MKVQQMTIAYRKGRAAARKGLPMSACPYNGPELRDEWFAGYYSVIR